MTEARAESIMEAACDICVWPYIFTDDTLYDEKCEHCPVEAAVKAAKEADDNALLQTVKITTEEIRKLPQMIADAMTSRPGNGVTKNDRNQGA